MFRRNLIVALKPIKCNSVILPDSYFRQVHTYENGCIALNYNNDVHYISWAPYGSSITETEIGINSTVAKAIGLKEGMLVKCSLVADVIVLDTVHVTATSRKDWEMLEVSSYRIQSTVLDQTRVVNNHQSLVIWINKALTITVKINRLSPNTTHGRLANNTEVIIAPYSSSQSNLTNGTASHHEIDKLEKSLSNHFSDKETKIMQNQNVVSDQVTIEKATREYDQLMTLVKRFSPPEFWFRVIPSKWEDTPMCNLYLTKHNLPETLDINDVYRLKTVENNEYFVNVRILRDEEIFPTNIYPSIEMNEVLMDHLGLESYEKIVLQQKYTERNYIDRIELAPNTKSVDYKLIKDIECQFKEYIIENTKLYPVLINQHQIIKLKDYTVSAFIYPDTFKYCLVDSGVLRKCRIKCLDKPKEINIDGKNDKTEQNKLEKAEPLYIELDKFELLIGQISDDLKHFLCLNDTNVQRMTHNILLIGNSNGGRSTICKKILEKLAEKPYFCFSQTFHCVKHKGRKPESIQKDLRDMFQKCLCRSPAVLVLENLDVLGQIVTEQTQDAMYFNKVSHFIAELITEYTAGNSITVIATVTSKQNLNNYIYKPHGWHLFESILTVPNLDKTDREKLICSFCKNYKLNPPNPEKVANLTEGYQIGDLIQFIERAVYYACRDNPAQPQLTNANLGDSLSNTSAYCMEGIEHNTENMSIDDDDSIDDHQVTGMDEVIDVLQEVIVWPMKYPEIFDYAPIRIPSAVLLYGPPGTGKTHLMNNLAKLWHLRIINVKGPELLAKYIGQSEENVRNVFKRARAARPCILFFDEFDSLAPKRGHDSTGVTDRVVNQMLTELDGIEEQKGVILVAATCRPELIDPALLRPGRIDRHVECKLPNQKDRFAIFKTLSNSLCLDESVNLEFFSEKTANYTGADIQSILTTANMIAVKECLAKNKKIVPEKIILNQNHLIKSFNETRPSLSKDDLAKYKLMYSRFSKKERTEMVTQKVSLA